MRGAPGFLGALGTAHTRWRDDLGLRFPGGDIAILVVLLDLPERGPGGSRITHEQFEFGKGLRRDTTATPGDLPDIATLIARPGDLPERAVFDHLNLKVPRHQETHLDRRDFGLGWHVERVGLPFVGDTLTRIEITMSPRSCCQE